MVSKKAFVHIGYPKTGTTALQAFFHHNSSEFLKKGILYPEVGKLWHGQHELAGLFQNEDKRLHWVKTDPQKPYLELLKEEIRESQCSTLVLSSEAFTFTNKHLTLKEFLHAAGFQDISIVCFLRRQDLWVESAFTQVYKAGLYGFDFNTYSHTGWSMNYFAFLKLWENTFGKENLCIEILDKYIGHKDVVPVMAKLLGVEEYIPTHSSIQFNVSLLPDALHYSHLVHKENNKEMLGWVVGLLEQYSAKQKNRKFVFMSDAERKVFLQEYNSINGLLAREFLEREKPFSDFHGFESQVELYPSINETDLKPVISWVMREVEEKVSNGILEWVDRRKFLEDHNKIILRLGKTELGGNANSVKTPNHEGPSLTNLNQKVIGFPKVAIITRTKDRPIMLPRVLKSISKQTYKNFIWVLVNDAGDRAPIEQIGKQALDEGVDIKVIYRDRSYGMEAAANDGVCQSNSSYIVIHDDDDSWEAEFLEKTVSCLDENTGFPGVITWTNRIDEVLTDNCIHFKSASPYNHWLRNIYLSDLAVENRFPPISFLFRRAVYEKVGGFDEELPVLGDWDFHLKVLMEGDIHVLPYVLANYHFRINLEGNDIYGNTVTSGVEKHILYDAIYRNKKLREDLSKGVSGLGTLLALGQMFRRANYQSDVLARFVQASKNNRYISFIRKVLNV